jgi:hypothetical protein
LSHKNKLQNYGAQFDIKIQKFLKQNLFKIVKFLMADEREK